MGHRNREHLGGVDGDVRSVPAEFGFETTHSDAKEVFAYLKHVRRLPKSAEAIYGLSRRVERWPVAAGG